MSPILEINLFGGMQIHVDGSALPVIPSVRARMSLAYLATYRRPHTRAILAGLQWPDMPEANARLNEKAVWRGWIQHVRCGESAYLQSTREPVSFIENWMGELDRIEDTLYF
ncbi:MAG: hypothetical protein GY759_12505 [Chloroflexi bacterium]|nr:hypothetical protein [Chloroflexota bacterium]